MVLEADNMRGKTLRKRNMGIDKLKHIIEEFREMNERRSEKKHNVEG